MLGRIIVDGETEEIPFADPNARNLVAEVSCNVCKSQGFVLDTLGRDDTMPCYVILLCQTP